MKKKIILWLFLLLAASHTLAKKPKRLRLLYTAERHGRLSARPSPPAIVPSLPRAKRGGLARLVAFLKQERKRANDPLLIVSGGGEVAGGPYDLEEGAPAIGGLRTDLILRAMAQCPYDALCLGDEEFALGLTTLKRWQKRLGFPLLTANVELPAVNHPFESYKIFPCKGFKVALIGLTTGDLTKNEFGMALPESLVVHSPVEKGVALAKELRSQVDLIVFMSHIGELENRKLLAALDFPTIILSAHRRKGPDIFYRWHKGWLLDFDYGVSEVRELEVEMTAKEHISVSLKRHLLYQTLAESKTLKNQVRVAQQLAGKTRTLDIYALAECPHCGPAEELVASLQEKYPRQLKTRRFILTKDGEKPAHRLAESHLWRANRLSVTRSPQIFIGNVPYEGPLAGLEKTIQLSLQAEDEKEIAPLPLLEVDIILGKGQLRKSREKLTTALDALFPNCKMNFQFASAKAPYSALPHISMRGPVEKWPRFQEVLSEFLEPKGDGYVISTRFLPPTYFPQRAKTERAVTLLAKSSHLPWLRSLYLLLAKAKECQVETAIVDEEVRWTPPVGSLLIKEKKEKLLSTLPTPLPLPSILLNNRELLLPRDEADARFLLERANLISLRGTLSK